MAAVCATSVRFCDVGIGCAAGALARFDDRELRCSTASSWCVISICDANLRLADGRRHHVPRQHQPRALKLPRLVVALALRPSMARRLAPKMSSA